MRFAQPGIPWRRRAPDMDLVHAFQESEPSAQRAHMRAFFGHIPGDDDQFDEELGSYVICYCGGRLTPISQNKHGDTLVAAVWHNRPRQERDYE
jgi:hypothetical protein